MRAGAEHISYIMGENQGLENRAWENILLWKFKMAAERSNWNLKAFQRLEKYKMGSKLHDVTTCQESDRHIELTHFAFFAVRNGWHSSW